MDKSHPVLKRTVDSVHLTMSNCQCRIIKRAMLSCGQQSAVVWDISDAQAVSPNSR